MASLPVELWHHIFSYLDLSDLAKARLVSREWWDLINDDRLWKRLLLKRGITLDFVNLEKENEGIADSLESCDWAKACSTYYSRIDANWKERRYRTDKCPQSTECVAVRLPYMLTTFDSHSVVNVYRLVDAEFILSSRLPIPDDGKDGCVVPRMTSDTVFVVSKNAYGLIFKLGRRSFEFVTAVCLSNDERFESCSLEEDLPNFLRNTPHSNSFFAHCSATEGVLWILEDISRVFYVWNYHKSELILQIQILGLPGSPAPNSFQLVAMRNFVYCILPEEDSLSVYSPTGTRLFLYKRSQSMMSGFHVDEFGCGFIEHRLFVGDELVKVAMYLEMPSKSVTKLKITDPLAITVNGNLREAYCFSVQDGVASIVTASVDTGAVLKETMICPSLLVRPPPFPTILSRARLNVEMRLILGKYLAISGIDGVKPPSMSADHLSLYSISEEKCLWSHPLNTAKIVHLCDQFIITRGRHLRGGLRYVFDIYNFL